VELRSEGIHILEADLRDWSARVVHELALELRRRRFEAFVIRSAVAGTSVSAEEDLLAEAPGPGEEGRVLSVGVAEVLPPARDEGAETGTPAPGAREDDSVAPPPARARRGPRIALEIEIPAIDLSVRYETDRDAAIDFREAFRDLKARILDDPRVREWVARER
jgi:hypothetical protein